MWGGSRFGSSISYGFLIKNQIRTYIITGKNHPYTDNWAKSIGISGENPIFFSSLGPILPYKNGFSPIHKNLYKSVTVPGV